jgi:hypothetical protein
MLGAGGEGVGCFAQQAIGFNLPKQAFVFYIHPIFLVSPSIGSLILFGLLIRTNPKKAITLNTNPIKNKRSKFNHRSSGKRYLSSRILQ